MTAYGTIRNGGTREDAARDLYTKPYGKVVAICDDKVFGENSLYNGMSEIVIIHMTTDRRKFIVR